MFSFLITPENPVSTKYISNSFLPTDRGICIIKGAERTSTLLFHFWTWQMAQFDVMYSIFIHHAGSRVFLNDSNRLKIVGNLKPMYSEPNFGSVFAGTSLSY